MMVSSATTIFTLAKITNTNNGPNGSFSGDGITNLQHYINGTDPRVSQNAPPPPANSIVIGPHNPTTVGA